MDRTKLKGYGALLLVFLLGILLGGAGSRAMLQRHYRAMFREHGAFDYRSIMDRCGGPLRAQKAQMDSEIRALLRPDQQARYDQLLKDSEGRQPPPGGPIEPLP